MVAARGIPGEKFLGALAIYPMPAACCKIVRIPMNKGPLMRLAEILPDADVVCALEPDELGLSILVAVARWNWNGNPLTLTRFIQVERGGQASPSAYPSGRLNEVEIAIREAWAWLEGTALLVASGAYHEPTAVRELSRRGQKLALEPQARRDFSSRRISKESLHHKIREDVWALYHRGKYDTAVFEAMKAVEVAVRETAEMKPSDLGKDLMRRAFSPQSGPLTDKTAEPSEQQARSDLFAGAIGCYKNPQSHRKVAIDDPNEAAEIIMLANHLLRIVEARKEDRD
jgi:uncharacterized protein (TIGR02391 family)